MDDNYTQYQAMNLRFSEEEQLYTLHQPGAVPISLNRGSAVQLPVEFCWVFNAVLGPNLACDPKPREG